MDWSKHRTAYLVNPLDLYTGSSNSDKHGRRISRLRANEIAKVRSDRLFNQLQVQGLRTQRGSKYIYLFLARAIREATLSVAYTNNRCRKLTPHAKRYFQFYDFRDLAPEAPPVQELQIPSIYGPPGSLAFYLTRHPELDDPSLELQDLLSLALQSFWSELDLPLSTPISERYQSLLSYYNIDYQFLTNVATSLQQRLEPSYTMRRWSVTLDDLSVVTFPQTFEISQYPEAILTEWELCQRAANSSDEFAVKYNIQKAQDPFRLTKSAKRLLRLAPPAGMSLVYQAIVIELYLNIITQFQQLDDNVLSLPLPAFSKHDDVKALIPEVVESLAGIYDAYTKLSRVRGMEGIENKATMTYDSLRRWMLSGDIDSLLPSRHRIGTASLDLQVYTLDDTHPFQVYNNWRPISRLPNRRLIISTERSVIQNTLNLNIDYLFVPTPQAYTIQSLQVDKEDIWITILTQDYYMAPRRYTITLGESKSISLSLFNQDYGVLIASIGSPDLEVADVTSNALVYQNYRI